MGYNTESTQWPQTPVPEAVKTLIDRLFNLLDNADPKVGDILADEIFAADAKAEFGPHTFEGKDRMAKAFYLPRQGI